MRTAVALYATAAAAAFAIAYVYVALFFDGFGD
jgi:hypothetical protein